MTPMEKYKYKKRVSPFHNYLFMLYDWLMFTKENNDETWHNYLFFMDYCEEKIKELGLSVKYIPRLVTWENHASKYIYLKSIIDLDSIKHGIFIDDDTLVMRMGRISVDNTKFPKFDDGSLDCKK